VEEEQRDAPLVVGRVPLEDSRTGDEDVLPLTSADPIRAVTRDEA
jgi:hypothetical protein